MDNELENRIVSELLRQQGSALTHFTVSSFALPAERHDTVSSFCRRSVAPSVALVNSAIDSALATLRSPLISVTTAPVETMTPYGPAYIASPKVVHFGKATYLRVVARVIAEAALVVVTLYIALLGGRQIVRAAEAAQPLLPQVVATAESRLSNDGSAISEDVTSLRARLHAPTISLLNE